MDYTEFNDKVDGLYRGDYAGLPIVRLRPPGAPMPAADQAAWRISVNVYDAKETFEEHFARFLDAVDVEEVKAIIIGGWGEAYEEDSAVPVRLLVENAARFPALRSLFFGAMPSEECEISWIRQSDVTPLLGAFPPGGSGVRGGRAGVRAGPARELRDPAVRDGRAAGRGGPGGRRRRSARAGASGAVARVGRLRRRHHRRRPGPILSGEPAAGAAASGPAGQRDPGRDRRRRWRSAPVVARLESLACRWACSADEGAEALLAGQPLTHLRAPRPAPPLPDRAMAERLRCPAGRPADHRTAREPYEWYPDERYVAVSEMSVLAVVGTPGDRRVTMFADACAGYGVREPAVVPWTSVLRRRGDRLEPGTLVRIDSPGEDAEADGLLRGPGEPSRVGGGARWHAAFTAGTARVPRPSTGHPERCCSPTSARSR